MKNLSNLLNVILMIAVAILAVMVWHEHEMISIMQDAFEYELEMRDRIVDEYYISEEDAYDTYIDIKDEYEERIQEWEDQYHDLELEYTELEKEYELFEDIMDDVLYDYELTIVKEE